MGGPVALETARGGYAFVPGLGFASIGVIAGPGMTVERATFAAPIPLPDGYDAVRAHLDSVGRPLEALCGFDLRLPAARSFADFEAFNRDYLAQLAAWELLTDAGCPLARTNVAPVSGAPPRPAVAAFSYTVESRSELESFVVSGVPELPDNATGPQDIVRLGETSADALAEKLRFVVDLVATRVGALGATWDNSVAVNLYAGHDLAFGLVREVLADRGIVPAHGISWHDAAPPVDLVELEVDVRRYGREVTVA